MSDDSGSETSDRYELEDLFAGEADDTKQLLKAGAVVVLVALLILALAFPFWVEVNSPDAGAAAAPSAVEPTTADE